MQTHNSTINAVPATPFGLARSSFLARISFMVGPS
jgi:hypothetical protein